MTFNLGPGATTRQGLEGGRGRDGNPATIRSLHDGLRERVLGVAFDCSGESERLGIAADVGEHGLAPGEGSGLVEDDGIHRAGPLEGHPVLDEQPVLGAE